MGEKWTGGDDMANSPGGGFKVNLLKEDLDQYKDRDDLILMFTDSYDVVILGDAQEIIEEFEKFDAKVVFGAESFCWPDESLREKYPREIGSGKRFLNSGGFIGYAKDIHSIVNHHDLEDTDDDQLYYTHIYLNDEMRQKHNIKLDHKSKIFQNLNGATSEIELSVDETYPKLFNTMYDTQPLVLHGNGPSKRVLNTLANYVPRAWNKDDQCTACWEDTLAFEELTEIPYVMIAIFIEKPTPFIEEFFAKIAHLDYDKSKVSLFIHNNVEYHEEDVEAFLEEFKNEYKSVDMLTPKDHLKEWHARNKGITKCQSMKCDFYFSVDSDAHIDNSKTLQILIEQNRQVVAPLLLRPYKVKLSRIVQFF